MACTGCAKRREWIAKQIAKLLPSGKIVSANVRGVSVVLKTEGNRTTVFVRQEELGTVEGDSEQQRFRGIIDMVEAYKTGLTQ